jgi:hypothetical protein
VNRLRRWTISGIAAIPIRRATPATFRRIERAFSVHQSSDESAKADKRHKRARFWLSVITNGNDGRTSKPVVAEVMRGVWVLIIARKTIVQQ